MTRLAYLIFLLPMAAFGQQVVGGGSGSGPTIAAGTNVSVSGAGCTGSGTCTISSSAISGATTNVLQKATSATALGNSSFTDTGSAASTTEPFSAPSFSTTGTGSGCYILSGASSGSAAICVPSAAGTPSKLLLPTTDCSSGPCVLYASSASGGSQQYSTINMFAPPYLHLGSNYYIAATGYQAVLPSASPVWINNVAPTLASGTNGDVIISGTGTYFEAQTATTSVEAVFTVNTLQGSSLTSISPNGGVWLYDSTNSVLWLWALVQGSANTGNNGLTITKYTYSGTGNPGYSAGIVYYNFQSGSPVQLKISVAGGTASFSYSADGGATYVTYPQTESVGTIAQGGYYLATNGYAGAEMTVMSIKVQ